MDTGRNTVIQLRYAGKLARARIPLPGDTQHKHNSTTPGPGDELRPRWLEATLQFFPGLFPYDSLFLSTSS